MEILKLFFTKETAEKIHKNLPGTDLLGRMRRTINSAINNRVFIHKIFLVNENTKRLFNIQIPVGMTEETAYWMVIRALLLDYFENSHLLLQNSVSSPLNAGNFITVRKKMNLERWLSCDKLNQKQGIQQEKGKGERQIILYHGTDLASALRIKENGIDRKYLGRNNEYGSGFYTTTFYQYALSFALIHEYPAILIILVDNKYTQYLEECENVTNGITKEEWIKHIDCELKWWIPYNGNLTDAIRKSSILHNVRVPLYFTSNDKYSTHTIKNVINLHPEYKQTVLRDDIAIQFANDCVMQVVHVV